MDKGCLDRPMPVCPDLEEDKSEWKNVMKQTKPLHGQGWVIKAEAQNYLSMIFIT